MVKEATKAAIRAKVKELAQEAGLRRSGLAASLGEGLRRLWGIDPQADERAVQKIVILKFEQMLDEIPDSSHQRFLRRSDRLCYNISPYTDKYSFGYTDRQRCLDRKFREERKLSPISFSRSIGSVRTDADKVYDHLAIRGEPSIDHTRAVSHSLKGPIHSSARDYLAELLYGDNTPPFVVLDNLDSADELHHLVPVPPRSVVVATCRTKGLTPPDYCQFIDVGIMTKEESRDLVVRELPGVNESDVLYLADSLYHFPLLIRHVCVRMCNP